MTEWTEIGKERCFYCRKKVEPVVWLDKSKALVVKCRDGHVEVVK